MTKNSPKNYTFTKNLLYFQNLECLVLLYFQFLPWNNSPKNESTFPSASQHNRVAQAEMASYTAVIQVYASREIRNCFNKDIIYTQSHSGDFSFMKG